MDNLKFSFQASVEDCDVYRLGTSDLLGTLLNTVCIRVAHHEFRDRLTPTPQWSQYCLVGEADEDFGETLFRQAMLGKGTVVRVQFSLLGHTIASDAYMSECKHKGRLYEVVLQSQGKPMITPEFSQSL
jgi:hypothetical protein